uniref:Uncharacterized protein n=1 Tax=Rhipicephalus appendiculatus TaxID=34631 RepID=A0A131YEB8_RHIAP
MPQRLIKPFKLALYHKMHCRESSCTLSADHCIHERFRAMQLQTSLKCIGMVHFKASKCNINQTQVQGMFFFNLSLHICSAVCKKEKEKKERERVGWRPYQHRNYNHMTQGKKEGSSGDGRIIQKLKLQHKNKHASDPDKEQPAVSNKDIARPLPLTSRPAEL